MRCRDRQAGAATLLAVAIVAAMLVLLSAFAPVVVLLGAHERATAAADAGALAGADTALGVTPGIPCEAAVHIARVDGADTARCRQRGTDVRVDVTVTALGLAVPAAARAGPPEESPVQALPGPSPQAGSGAVGPASGVPARSSRRRRFTRDG